MKKKTWGKILQAPAILLLVLSFFASIYAKFSGKFPISLGTPIILLLILVAYFYGRHIENKNEFSF